MDATPLHLATEPAQPTPTITEDWADPHLVNQTRAERRREQAGAFLLLALITAADLVLIKATLDHALRLPEQWSWLTAVGLTATAVTLAFQSGVQTRIAEATGRTPARTAILVVLGLAWLLVGIGMFWLRWNAATFTQAAADYEATGAAGGVTDGDQSHKLLAVVLATVYAATGALAWLDGHKLTNRAATAMHRAARRLEKINPQVADKTARVTRLAENLTIHTHDLDTIEAHRLNARRARHALVGELKEHARVQIALNLGDPEATGLTQNRPATQPDQDNTGSTTDDQ